MLGPAALSCLRCSSEIRPGMNRQFTVRNFGFMYLAVRSFSDTIRGIDWMRILCVIADYTATLNVALICGLMNEDPKTRMTVEEALEHPWVTRYHAFYQC